MIALCALIIPVLHVCVCFQAWLRVTATYLYGDPVIEWLCALLACVFAATSAFGIFELQRHCHEVHSAYLKGSADRQDDVSHLGWLRGCVLWSIWALSLCILTSPMALAMLSLSVPPGDNVLQLDDFVLKTITVSMGAILCVLSTTAIVTGY